MNQQELIHELRNYARNAVTTASMTQNQNWTSNYHNFREQVWEYQIEHNISGLIIKKITIENIQYEIRCVESQLILLPDDLRKLRESKNQVVEIFKNHARNVYEHVQDLIFKNDTFPYVQVPISRVNQRAYKSDWAELWLDPHCNQIHLNLGCGNDPEGSKYNYHKSSRDNYDFVTPLDYEFPSY